MGTQATSSSSAASEPRSAAAEALACGPGDEDVRSVLDSIRRIVRDLRVASRAAEKAVGLSAAQLFVLQKLAEGPAVSVNDLAERTSTDQSSVSVVVQRLANAGLLRRRQSGEDARRVEISITPKARALLEEAPAAAQDRLIGALCRTPAASRRQLARLLEALVHEIGLDSGTADMFFEEDAARRARPSRNGKRSSSSTSSPKPQGRNKRNARPG